MEKIVKNKAMMVSVCMATYNGESHITQQLSSILNQEFINNTSDSGF